MIQRSYNVISMNDEQLTQPPSMDDEHQARRAEILDAPLEPRCPKCNYDLTGHIENESAPCPECGHAWTVDELALQHVIRLHRRSGLLRMFWIISPGPIAVFVLLISFMLGQIVAWLAAAGCVVYFVLTIHSWGRSLYVESMIKGRPFWRRTLYIVGGMAMFTIINIVEVFAILFGLVLLQNRLL